MVRHMTSARCQGTWRLETSEGQTPLNMDINGRERPLPSTSEPSLPWRRRKQSKLEEDHSFGDATLVGAYRQEEEVDHKLKIQVEAMGSRCANSDRQTINLLAPFLPILELSICVFITVFRFISFRYFRYSRKPLMDIWASVHDCPSRVKLGF